MRSNANVQVGQVWRSSDPRRLSAFKIFDMYVKDGFCFAINVYPVRGTQADLRTLAIEWFQVTGPKGYHRIS